MTNSCLQLEKLFFSFGFICIFTLGPKRFKTKRPNRSKTRLANDNKYEKDVKTIAAIFPPTLYRWCLKGNLPSTPFPPLVFPTFSASWSRLLFAAASSVLSRVKVLRFGSKLWPQLQLLLPRLMLLLLYFF